MNKEPIKHHYIPQFILRNFCFDDESHLLYYDKKTSKILKRETKEIFMVKNLYRDDINSPDEPTKIEKDMSRFESEVAKIIRERFLTKDEISITRDEDEKLKLFFAIMAFRSKITSNKFGDGAPGEFKKFYSMYQQDGNLSDFWKRNLGNLVNCRSWREVRDHREIDMPIKIFFKEDIWGISGRYFIVAERRGHMDFVISDVYPTIISGEMDGGRKLQMYSIFPISPERIILLANIGVEGAPKNLAVFSDEILKKPKWNSNKGIITTHVKKIYENEVKYVNSELIKNAYEGFAFRNEDRVDIK